jgi:hypothetical protein
MVQRPAIRRAELKQAPRFLPSWSVLDTETERGLSRKKKRDREKTIMGDRIELLSKFKTPPCFARKFAAGSRFQ